MEKKAYIINLLISLGKFHIHRCKFTNQKPFFSVLLKELENGLFGQFSIVFMQFLYCVPVYL